jgi:hypothetical protein
VLRSPTTTAVMDVKRSATEIAAEAGIAIAAKSMLRRRLNTIKRASSTTTMLLSRTTINYNYSPQPKYYPPPTPPGISLFFGL